MSGDNNRPQALTGNVRIDSNCQFLTEDQIRPRQYDHTTYMHNDNVNVNNRFIKRRVTRHLYCAVCVIV